MALVFTSDELISSIRRIGSIPNTGAPGFADSDILRCATETLWSKVVPNLIKTREEYYANIERRTVAASITRYRIPKRAIMQKLRDVSLVGGDGANTYLRSLQREEVSGSQSTGTVLGYYLEGNDVILVPSPSAGTTLEFAYFFRPGSLVLVANARQITAVDPVTRTVTLSSANTSWSTSNIFDIHSKESGAEIKIWDAAATTVGATIVFSASFPIDGSTAGTRAVEVGDWVCLAEEAAVPGCPKEIHPLLALAVAMRFASSTGDMEVFKAQAAEYSSDMKALVGIAESRVEGKPIRIRGHRGFLGRMR